MASNQHDIEVLNDLIEITLDSAHGYEDAVSDTKNARFKTLFGKHSMRRKQVTAELQTEVRRLLGGHPAQSGTTVGKVHRTFMNVKAAITGSDEGLVNTVEAAEDHIKAKYEKALRDEDLSTPVHDLVARAFIEVKAGHDEVRDIKRALNG